MTSREHILSEIKRVALEIGRTPGKIVFEQESGIGEKEWLGKHWRSWGDAVKDAGLSENQRQAKFSKEVVLEQYALAVRHYGRIPANIDLRMFASQHDDFPSHNVFHNHFNGKSGLITAFSSWVRANSAYHDLIELLPTEQAIIKEHEEPLKEGHVYLLRWGEHYKIGRSDQIERRIKQINVKLPEEGNFEHSIRTDDPAGIEAYWHRRFADRRANGEWFKLSRSDIKAFKRRTFQ